MLGEGVELPFPEDPVAGDPAGGVLHGLPHETAPVHPAVSLPSQKPGSLENAEVLGDGGERHVEGLGQLRHRGLAARQVREDRPAGGIGQRRKGRVEGTWMLNHVVKYRRRPGPCQGGPQGMRG